MNGTRKLQVTWIETIVQSATFEVKPGFDPVNGVGVDFLMENISVSNAEGDFPRVNLVSRTLANWRWVNDGED